ncbi:MAG: pyridoxal phosphate-dependent aminotransferase [Enterococcus sp.]
MRDFEKSIKLDGVSYDVRGPVLEEAERMQEEGIDILKLNTGNPATFGFKAPNEVIRDLIMNVRESEGYSDSKGIFSARKAIEQYCQLKKFPNVTINDIYTGNGVSELITMCMQGLVDAGDEVLVPMPDYPLWTAAVSLAGGTPVHYICDESAEWYPDIADIKSKVTSRTKAIIIINPNNPTGALYPKELLEEIVEVARQNDLIIYSDEIYDRLVMDGAEHIPIATLAPDRFVVTLNGLSKSHRVAGFRVGWMVLSGDKSHVKGYIEGLNMLSSMRLCSNVLSQQVIQTALGGFQSSDDLLLPGGRIYEQREFIYNAINDIPGLSAVKPKAAFYIFPKIDTKKFNIVDDEQFVLDFLHQHHILLVHGGGFNWQQPDHFRIVYLPELEDLKTTAVKMREFLSTYRQK